MVEQLFIIGKVPVNCSDDVFVIGSHKDKIVLQLTENEDDPLATDVYVIEPSDISENERNTLVLGKDWWDQNSAFWGDVGRMLKTFIDSQDSCMSTSDLVSGWEIIQEEAEVSGNFQRLYDDEGTAEINNLNGKFNGFFFLYLTNLQGENQSADDYDADERIVVFTRK